MKFQEDLSYPSQTSGGDMTLPKSNLFPINGTTVSVLIRIIHGENTNDIYIHYSNNYLQGN